MAFLARIFCIFSIVVAGWVPLGAAEVLRLGIIAPPPHKWTKTAGAIAVELKEKDPSLELSVFPSGQLGNEAQMLQLLQTGAMDFAMMTTSEFANRLPEFAAFYIPYVAEDAAHAARILEGEVAADILAETKKLGLVGMGFGMGGMRQIVSSKLVQDAGDLKGLKVRVMSDKPLIDFWRLAGTAPTAIPLSVLYDAFANGQVDAMHIDFENTLRLKFHKHAESVLHSDHMIFPLVAVASAKSWARFTDAQKMMISAMFKRHLAGLREAYVDADKGFKKALQDEGARIEKVGKDFFGQAADEWYARWSDRTDFVALLKEEAERVR